MADATEEAPAWTARKLLRAARAASLATQSDGQPFASLVTPACAPDGSLLMLLSGLSPHTRHLVADPRCAIMVMGEAPDLNPQTAPRITVTGVAEMAPDPALKARWLAIHPYAAFYADLGDFALWRMVPRAGAFVGGFARAARLSADELLPSADEVAALAAAEPGILGHCNADHADTLMLLAGGGDGWRMVTADVDGCDLAAGDRVLRIAWSMPVADADGVRRELIKSARAIRGQTV